MRQRVTDLVLNASSLRDVQIKLGESQTPPGVSFGGICEDVNPLESVVVSAYCVTFPSALRAEEKY